MRFYELLESRNITSYALAKTTGIPYTTINDLLHYRTLPKNISLEHALKIAKVLDVSLEELAAIEGAPMTEFDFFRTNLLNDINMLGPVRWINKTIKNKVIDFYYKNGGVAHALFMLATLDYLSRKNHLSFYQKRYNDLRKMKLDKVLFTGMNLLTFSSVEEAERLLAVKIAPEYRRFNIIETDITSLY